MLSDADADLLKPKNAAAEQAYVKAVRKAARRAVIAGARPTTIMMESLLQAAGAHLTRWRSREDFLQWAGDMYDEAVKHVQQNHEH